MSTIHVPTAGAEPAQIARTVQATVARDWRAVCDFLFDARQFARWASWLRGLVQRDGEWLVERAGEVPAKARFTERNAFGIADHWLLHDEDDARFVALRALPNGAGTEVVLTLFGTDAAAAQHAARDLQRLKAIVEDAPQRTSLHAPRAIVLPIAGVAWLNAPTAAGTRSCG